MYLVLGCEVVLQYLRLILCKGIRIPECVKSLLVESEILGYGTWNTAQGIRNPVYDMKPESSSIDKDWNPVPGILNPGPS